MTTRNSKKDPMDDIEIDMSIPDGAEIVKVVGGMSDAAIESAVVAQDVEDSTAKPFRYKPTESTSLLLARTTSKTGLTTQEVVTIALMLLQDASIVEVQRAVTAILQDRAQALFDSLK